MFQMTCSTCSAELVIKHDELIGQVLPCPKCGSLVKIYAPDEAPTPPLRKVNKPAAFRRFPDVLSSETLSGIIGQQALKTRDTTVTMNTAPTAEPVKPAWTEIPDGLPEESDSKVSSRRFTLYVLCTVFVVLTAIYILKRCLF
jgi:DNA-directed RNA polymerase subunit RPC12/RpoP